MNRRVAIVISFVSLFSLGCLCCGGIGNREATESKLKEANAKWDANDKSSAVTEYKVVFDDALTSEKEEMLPRIVAFEVEAGNRDEAKKWIQRGMDDGLGIEYTGDVEKELVAAIEQEKTEVAAAAAEDKRKEREEAALRAEEEIDVDGLVLMRKSVKGTQTQLGMEITGTVENRRNRKLGYAQITFNIYDSSGAQVGSAIANINGLEPGGRWNFKAVAFTKGTTYKFSELTGF